MSTDRTDQYPEVSGEDAGLVPPQGSPKPEWPKKIRTLTASELDRLTIDGLGRFYWDGQLVNYEGHSSRIEPKPVDLDRSAMELLDRAARELADPNSVSAEPQAEQAVATEQAPATADQPAPVMPAVATVPVVAPAVEVRHDEVVRSVAIPTLVHSDRVRVSLSGWQSLGLIIVILALLIGAGGFAAQGFVAANDWGCRVGLVKAYCPSPPPEPKAPARADIPA